MVIFDICFGDEAGLVKTLGNRNNTGIYIYMETEFSGKFLETDISGLSLFYVP